MEAFEKQDVPVAIETDDAQLRTMEAGDMTVTFMTLKQQTVIRHIQGGG